MRLALLEKLLEHAAPCAGLVCVPAEHGIILCPTPSANNTGV